MSLANGYPRFQIGGKTDVANLHRLDSNAAQDEFPVDRFADANVHDLPVARKRDDEVRRSSERTDVVIGKLRRHWSRGLRRRLRHGRWRGRRRQVDYRRRWRRWWRLLVREKIPLGPVHAALRFEPFGVDDADSLRRRSDGALRFGSRRGRMRQQK